MLAKMFAAVGHEPAHRRPLIGARSPLPSCNGFCIFHELAALLLSVGKTGKTASITSPHKMQIVLPLLLLS